MNNVKILRGESMKEGDTFPDLRVKLMDGDDPFNLTGYTVDVTIIRTDGDTPIVDTDATVVDENRGLVSYSWQAGDTDTSGTYLVEFVADDGSGSVATFPNDSYARIYIEDRL